MKFLSPVPFFRVALCVDGPKRFCLNSKHLLGKEATKQRHLHLLGYQVVQVWFCLFFFPPKAISSSDLLFPGY